MRKSKWGNFCSFVIFPLAFLESFTCPLHNECLLSLLVNQFQRCKIHVQVFFMERPLRPLIGDEWRCLFSSWIPLTVQYLLPFLFIPSLSSSPLHSQCLMLVAHLEVCGICLRSILDSIDVVDDVWLCIFMHMWNQSQILVSVICKMLKLLCNRAIFPMYLVIDIEVGLYKNCISIPMLFFNCLRINLCTESVTCILCMPLGHLLKVS